MDFVDGFKSRGVPMGRTLVAVRTHIPMGSNSMNRCSERLLDPNVRKELGLDSGLSQRTVNVPFPSSGTMAMR